MQLGTFFSISEQCAFFLMSVVLGAALGVVYDMFRVLRILFPPAARDGAVLIGDILFCLLYGFGIFCYSAAVCGGSIRLFMLLGSLLGFGLYILTLGNLVTGVLRKIVTAVWKILRKVYSALFEPVVILVKKLCQKAGAFFVRFYKKSRIEKKTLQNPGGMVYNSNGELHAGGERGGRGKVKKGQENT